MIDISMQGATLTFSNPKLAADIVLEFSDEGTPMEFPNLETCGYSMTMNLAGASLAKPCPASSVRAREGAGCGSVGAVSGA